MDGRPADAGEVAGGRGPQGAGVEALLDGLHEHAGRLVAAPVAAAGCALVALGLRRTPQDA